MKSILDEEVSCFQSYSHNKPKNVNLLKWLTSDKYAKEIEELRSIEDKKVRDRIKASLPAITVSGIFNPTRKEEHLVKHSGLICVDIDPKGNEQIENYEELKHELFKINNVAYVGLSASGKGFFLIIPIQSPKNHKKHFRAIQNEFLSLGLIIDTAPQNVASLRGYSYDPNGMFRHDALPYRKWSTQKVHDPALSTRKKAYCFSPSTNQMTTREKVEAIVRQIVDQRIDITQNEPDWFRLACALANEFGEGGRGYFHEISQFYPGYDVKEADGKFDYALKKRYSAISLGTFFKLAQTNSL